MEAVGLSHEAFVFGAPARDPRRPLLHELVRAAQKLVGHHRAAYQPAVAVREIAQGHSGARPKIVVDLVSKQPGYPDVGMGLEIAANPIVPISEPPRMHGAAGKQQKARGFLRRARHDYDIRRLFLQPVAIIEVGHAGYPAAPVGEDLARHGSRFAVRSSPWRWLWE